MSELRIVFLGLSITSSWGNGHATNFRGLLRALDRRGHDVTFLERDMPWYAEHRDLPDPPFGRTELYGSVAELRDRFAADVGEADLVVVGSYVPDGAEVGRWVTETAGGATAFYDIDTPVTLAALEEGTCVYLTPDLIPKYDLYLSFTGGPTLHHIEQRYGSPRARAFYCLVDPDAYQPADGPRRWALGYLGTYSDDRQPVLDQLLLEPARRASSLDQGPAQKRFVVAGPQYPDSIAWPANVDRIDHLPPADHAGFYNGQHLTLNVTRVDMVRAGWSPSVRLFEAAACGVPIVSDWWEGLDHFFRPDVEILVARSAEDVEHHLATVDDERRAVIGAAARARVLAAHTAEHRADELEAHAASLLGHGAALMSLQSTGPGIGPSAAPNNRGGGAADGRLAEIAALAPWFHNLRLPGGVTTAPDHPLGDFPSYKWDQIAPSLPDDLRGCRALDIGCNAGFYSFELAKRGADVVSVDHDEHYLRQARWAAGQLGLDDQIELRLLDVYDLAHLQETFDIVLFLGVLYHLRYPLLGLDIVAERVRGTLILQTLTRPGDDTIDAPADVPFGDRDVLSDPAWPAMAFIEHHFAGDHTNWWAPSAGAVEAMVRTTGLRVIDRPGHEIWVCERSRETHHQDELDRATGRRRRG